MAENDNEPVYAIGKTAETLQTCRATLRIWERKGLIRPSRLGKNRYYSRCDVERLKYIKELIQQKHINIAGVKALLSMVHCWDIKKCDAPTREKCSVYLSFNHG